MKNKLRKRDEKKLRKLNESVLFDGFVSGTESQNELIEALCCATTDDVSVTKGKSDSVPAKRLNFDSS